MSFVTIPSGSELWDPFAASADPGTYVPREGTERALDGLEQAVLAGARASLLVAEPGLGKSLLLRVLEQRLASRRPTALLPYPALPLADLCAWAGSLLGLPPGSNPEDRLLECARSGKAGLRGLVLLLDDMADLPEATLTGLVSLIEASGGALQLVGAADPAAACVVADACPHVESMWLLEPMSFDELGRYVAVLLGGVPDLGAGRAPFDDVGLTRLHQISEGIPSQVNAEAARMLGRWLSDS